MYRAFEALGSGNQWLVDKKQTQVHMQNIRSFISAPVHDAKELAAQNRRKRRQRFRYLCPKVTMHVLRMATLPSD